MIVLVCGGRDFKNETVVTTVLSQRHAKSPFTRLVEGGARGIDSFARQWAWKNKVPVWTFKAEWGKYGPAAGPLRNHRMLVEAKPDLVIAFPGGTGTANMVAQARQAGVAVEEIPINTQLTHERRAEGR